MKAIKKLLRAPPRGHWVGDGFPVRAIFSDMAFTQEISPFLMFDYGGPHDFAPTEIQRGVGPHPHRGFETVTIAFQGEIEHADSVGNKDVIGPGDVQWMTAASGIIHEEMHSKKFSRQGGALEMAQLWVNLPAKSKMNPPHYQPIVSAKIPVHQLDADSGRVRVIAGNFSSTQGTASTHTQINLWDMHIHAGKTIDFTVPAGHNTMLFVRTGKLVLNEETLGAADLVIMELDGQHIQLRAMESCNLLLMGGEPINEPIAARGPFVMNTDQEIRQAMMDYQSGKMGHMAG